MKPGKYRLLSAALLLAAVYPAFAQTVTVIRVGKEVTRTQIAAPGVGATTQGSTPFAFDVYVSGTGLSAPTVTLPGSSTYPAQPGTSHNGGTLVLNSEGDWGYGTPNGFGAQTNNTNIDTYFALGDYTVTVPSVGAVTLTLDGAYNNATFGLPNQPVMTMTGGSWSGGKYFIDVTQPLTVTTNAFGGYLTTGIGGHIFLGLWDDNSDLADVEFFSRVGPSGVTFDEVNNTATFTIPANTLVAGTDYFGEASFTRIVDQSTDIAGAFSVSYYEATTNFTISAVPEPSTYAAFAGLGALALAYWRRRAAKVA